jgi:RecJ-like exonuclease
MPNVRLYFATIAALLLAGYLWGLWQYQTGWREGRSDLITEQAADTEKLRQENSQRQLVEDVKAVEAEQQGEAKTITITKEVIRYVKTPGRTVCVFPDERVQLKARAATNASTIPGFDDPSVPDAAAGK